MTPVEDARAAVRLALQKVDRCEAQLKDALGQLAQQKLSLEDVLAVLAESDFPRDTNRMTAPARDLFEYFNVATTPAAPPAPARRTEVRAHLRRVKGAPLPSPVERKDAALDAHEMDRVKKLAIDYLRRALAELYAERDADPMRFPVAYVNADDVARLLANWPSRPKLLDNIEGHWKGAIFRKGFALTGHSHPSLRAHMNGTSLPSWRVKR